MKPIYQITVVCDFFQCIRLPMKSAKLSAQARSAALNMIRFRRFDSVTSAFSSVAIVRWLHHWFVSAV
jgi:hypothetical protein